MEQQDKKLFEDLGYYTGCKGIQLFNDIISEVEECMDKYSHDGVMALINNKNSYIYVEAKIFYEIGLNYIQTELNKVHNQLRNVNRCNEDIYRQVFHSNTNPTLEEAIFAIADYRKKQKEMSLKSNHLQKVKKVSL